MTLTELIEYCRKFEGYCSIEMEWSHWSKNRDREEVKWKFYHQKNNDPATSLEASTIQELYEEIYKHFEPKDLTIEQQIAGVDI